jgi:hypothetical protein
MRSYLVERSVQVYVDTFGEGVLDQSADGLQLIGKGADELCDLVADQVITFKVVDGREDQVGQTVQMSDQLGNATFLGWREVHLDRVNGGLVVMGSDAISLQMSDRVMVEVPADIIWVNVLTRDESGNVVGGLYCSISKMNEQYYLEFPTTACGDSFAPGYYGELTAQRRTSGGGYMTSVYNLSTGEELPSTDVSMVISPSIEGVKVLAVDSDIIEILPSTGGVGMNTTFILTVTKKMEVITKAKTSEGELAVGCFIKAVLGEAGSAYVSSPSVTLLPGKYHIQFAWSKFHELGERAEGWDYYDNGKG